MSRGYFKSSVCDLGEVVKGDIVGGDFMLKEGSVGIRKCDGGCTCGGRPRMTFIVDSIGFRFSVKCVEINGKKDVTRIVTVDMRDGGRQIVYVKYKVK